jgi:hypothetical protein
VTSEEHITVASVAERDVDLLLLEELIVNAEFLQHFLTLAGVRDSERWSIRRAERSATDSIGESDLVLHLTGTCGDCVVLVENKLSAAFQPKQAERYQQRGRQAVLAGAEFCHSVLVAPSEYAHGSTCNFDGRVNYEALICWLNDRTDLRSRYRATFLSLALQKGSLGYHPVGDQAVSNFWHCYWVYATHHAPELGMPQPNPKPSRSTFVFFHGAGLRPGVTLIHKMIHGFVDLELSGWGDKLGELQVRLGSVLRANMALVKTGRSASVRRSVATLQPSEAFCDQVDSVAEALAAARELRDWAQTLADLSQ